MPRSAARSSPEGDGAHGRGYRHHCDKQFQSSINNIGRVAGYPHDRSMRPLLAFLKGSLFLFIYEIHIFLKKYISLEQKKNQQNYSNNTQTTPPNKCWGESASCHSLKHPAMQPCLLCGFREVWQQMHLGSICSQQYQQCARFLTVFFSNAAAFIVQVDCFPTT